MPAKNVSTETLAVFASYIMIYSKAISRQLLAESSVYGQNCLLLVGICTLRKIIEESYYVYYRMFPAYLRYLRQQAALKITAF